MKSAALAFARQSGDERPARGELVGGTRISVVRHLMNGAEVDTDSNVYVIELQGDFAGYQLPLPTGGSPPKGRFLTLVYDATTQTLTDWGITNQHGDLALLGSPQTILP
jgi:hypothetical protein